MASKKKNKSKPSPTPKKEITVKTDLTFEQLLKLAATTPIKKKNVKGNSSSK